MLNPELEMADNLCMKSVALPVLIQLCSIFDLHNVLFLRIYTTRFLLSHLPCLKGMTQKRPHSRVQPPQSGNFMLKSLLGTHTVPVIFASGICRPRCGCCFTDANPDASLNCYRKAAELVHFFSGCWQGLVGHPGPPECGKVQGRAIIPHAHISPFRH